MAAQFEQTKKYPASKAPLMRAAVAALEQCRFNVRNVDDERGLIYAETNTSLWSYAELINVWVDDQGHVKMKSKCSFPTQFIDWGKNKKNVNRFFSFLEEDRTVFQESNP